MKFTRKKLFEEKKELKRLKVGLIVLALITLPLLFALKGKIGTSISSFWRENEVNKPIPNLNVKEQLVNLLAQNDIKATNVTLFNNKIVVYLLDGPTVIFDQNNIEKQVTSLQAVLTRFKIEGRKVNTIDLRFSKPVIK